MFLLWRTLHSHLLVWSSRVFKIPRSSYDSSMHTLKKKNGAREHQGQRMDFEAKQIRVGNLALPLSISMFNLLLWKAIWLS